MLPRPLHRHTPLLHLAREPSRGCSEVVGSAAGRASNGRNRDGDVVDDDNEEALKESGSESPLLLEWSDEEEGAAVPREVILGRTAADALDTMKAATGSAVAEDAASGQEYATLKHVEAGGEAGASTKPWPAAAQAALRGLVGWAVESVEDLYAHLLLCGQTRCSDKLYDISRVMHNTSIAYRALPSLTSLREKILPRIKAAWFLPTSDVSLQTRSGESTRLAVFLRSTHVARDLAFRETFALCTALDARTAGAEDLEPELVDAPLFWDRVNTLLSGLVLKCFSLHGVTFRQRDAVDVRFSVLPVFRGLLSVRAALPLPQRVLQPTTASTLGTSGWLFSATGQRLAFSMRTTVTPSSMTCSTGAPQGRRYGGSSAST